MGQLHYMAIKSFIFYDNDKWNYDANVNCNIVYMGGPNITCMLG